MLAPLVGGFGYGLASPRLRARRTRTEWTLFLLGAAGTLASWSAMGLISVPGLQSLDRWIYAARQATSGPGCDTLAWTTLFQQRTSQLTRCSSFPSRSCSCSRGSSSPVSFSPSDARFKLGAARLGDPMPSRLWYSDWSCISCVSCLPCRPLHQHSHGRRLRSGHSFSRGSPCSHSSIGSRHTGCGEVGRRTESWHGCCSSREQLGPWRSSSSPAPRPASRRGGAACQ